MRRAEEVKGHLNRGLPVALVSLWRAEVVKGHLVELHAERLRGK